ncbi:MAG: hypothetical protein KJ655_02015 [Candidatus Thermoplasmatota archaeon]|nr:hypothetical protein [Candidatus Thermoplasmatota archaeon]
MKNRVTNALIVILLATIIFGLFYPSYNTQQLSAYSGKWNDTSYFRENMVESGYETSCIASTPLMLKNMDRSRTLFIAVGVEKEYSKEEINTIEEFVRSGGKAIVADDFGYVNSLSERFGVLFYNKKFWCPNFTSDPDIINMDAVLSNLTYNLLMDAPTGLMVLGNATVNVICKSTTGYVDINNNKSLDLLDIMGSNEHPIFLIVKIHFGAGVIVFISDPSIFINEIIGESDNKLFLNELVRSLLHDGGCIVFDESRHENPLTMSSIVFVTTEPFAVIIGAMSITGIICYVLGRVKYKKRWKHIFDVGAYKKRPETENFKERMKNAVIEKVKIAYGISNIERLSARQMDEIAPALTKIVRGGSYSEEELRRLMEKIGSEKNGKY